MSTDTSFIIYFFQAGLVVKVVMLLLLLASLYSWYLICQKLFYLRFVYKNIAHFNEKSADIHDLSEYQRQLKSLKRDNSIDQLLSLGYQESKKRTLLATTERVRELRQKFNMKASAIVEQLQNHLGVFATIASTAPFVGLFGTVWGIMNSFRALQFVEHVTIAQIAPGISEALIATAMGLFVAIPATIFYNYFNDLVDRIINQYEIFTERFISLIMQKDFKQDKSEE